MIVAKLEITRSGWSAGSGTIVQIVFADMAAAEAEYKRVSDLLERRKNKANDIPNIIHIQGADSRTALIVEDLHAVSICDLGQFEYQMSETRGKYPNIEVAEAKRR